MYLIGILLCVLFVDINGNARKPISRQKCEEYGTLVDSCIQNEEIQGPAKPGDYPHMALVGYKSNKKIIWGCAGVLISDQYVLTTAHCLTRPNNKPIIVRLGELNIESEKDNTNIQDIKVSKLIPYPEYKQHYNNIGLIKLDKPVQINRYVRPACLPYINANINITNEIFIKSGWGLLNSPNYLQKPYLLYNKNIKAISYEDCDQFYGKEKKLPNGIDRNTQLCLKEEADTCMIQSGGPIQVYDQEVNCMHKIIGIVTFGKGICIKDIPEVATKISPYIQWIESVVWA